MRPTLPAAHLLRQYLLFAAVVMFLLLLVRAGYALWQLPAVESVGDPLGLFLTGLRFDLSLVGALCLVPVSVGSVLAMFGATRAVAKWFVLLWLVAALALVLVTELLTPQLLASEGVRPDVTTFTDLPALAASVGDLATGHPVPFAIGVLLAILILVAYVARVERARFLRYPLARGSTLALALVGSLVCLVAARSTIDPTASALSVADARLGGEEIVDQIAMNSAWTTLRSLGAMLLPGS